MTGLATSPADILHFLRDRGDDGQDTILVTLAAIEGSSPRALGTQMAIAANGDYAGSFSGGCIEAAVVAEALETLAVGTVRLVRFGAGSPYLDIRLPCGGGIDLLFTPRPDRAAIDRAIAHLDQRQPATLALSAAGVCAHEARSPTGWHGEDFMVTYVPRLRVVAIGQGEELTATARLAHVFGAETMAFSPHERDVRALRPGGIAAETLGLRTARPAIHSDPWTAFVFLFHDRDWEEALIPWALGLPKFYIGALGSRVSHAARNEMLRAAGVPCEAILALRSPVGLIPSTRDPAALAVSIVAEIIQEYTADANLAFAPDLAQVDAIQR